MAHIPEDLSEEKSKMYVDLFRTELQWTTLRFMLVGSTCPVTFVSCQLQVDRDVKTEGSKFIT